MAKFEFAGFPTETVAFLSDLRANNTRDWFTANKAVYERALKHPGAQFCAAMADELEVLTGAPHRSKNFRIHRDLRFSKDKTPYNAHLHISFTPQSDLSSPPCWFFGLEPDRVVLGAGVVAFDKQALERFRNRLLGTDANLLAKIFDMLRAKEISLNEPELKRVPAGYPADHPHGDLLRRRGLAAWTEAIDPEVASDPGFIEICRTNFKTLKPLYDWLMD